MRKIGSTLLTLGVLLAPPARATAQGAAGNAIADTLRPRALSALLADASTRNLLPPALLGYRAAVETELAMLLHREDRTEFTAAIEQVASTLQWERSGLTAQHVIGYRSMGTTVSMVSAGGGAGGWLTPTLYGNRFRLRVQRPDSARRTRPSPASRVPTRGNAMRADGSDTLPAVHPLATDRDRYYTFTGGDTVITLRVGARTIPIVQVRVRPRPGLTEKVLLLDGELDLDASRGTLVRIRGHFVRVNGSLPRTVRALVDPVAFIEYENGEHSGAYWLPVQQRIELMVGSPMLGDASAVMRIVSRFTDYAIRDTSGATTDSAGVPVVAPPGPLRRRLSYAPDDSIRRFGSWRARMGEVTGPMNAHDFADVGPDRMRPDGKPRFDVAAPRLSDVLRFNRVEGLYTGLGARLAFRDAAPGLTLRGTAGYAWNERTVRGRAELQRTRGAWTAELRGGRVLDNTNDFRTVFDSGSTIGALFGSSDPYDYVDHRTVSAGIVRQDLRHGLLLRADVGYVDDRYAAATYLRSPLGGDLYRANRGVDEGGYARSALLLDWRPDITVNVLRSGTSARLAYERGDGTLDFQRIEGRITSRRWLGQFLLSSRADAGVVTGARIPAQQLFELGNRQGLPGYEDKEFAGSRAAVARAAVMYQTSWLRRPIRLLGVYRMPAIAPGASIGIQGGWTEAPSAAARASVLRLGTTLDSAGTPLPVARVTDGTRATASVGLRFFSGGMFVGFARPIDRAAPWSFRVMGGQQW